MINQTVSMIDGLSSVMGPTLTMNSTNIIKSDSMEIGYAKASLETLKDPVKLNQGSFVGPDFSEVFKSNNDSNNTNTTNNVNSLVQQAVVFNSAMAGNNAGKKGASIGDSPSIGLSYTGSDNKELKVSNLSKPIDIWIKRNSELPLQDYSFINIDNIPEKSKLITYKFNLVGTQVSTHIQLKPLLNIARYNHSETTASIETSINLNFTNFTSVPLNEYPGYVFILKFGEIAQLSSTNVSYDEFKIMCPQGKSIYTFLYIFICL